MGIVDCFKLFVMNKRQIVIDLYELNGGDDNMNNLLFYALDQRKSEEEVPRKDDETSNLIRSETLALFPNVGTLIIPTGGYRSFSFSLMALLNVINGTNLTEIVIKCEEYEGHNWIKSVWKSKGEMLRKEYNAKGYIISVGKSEASFE